VPHALVCAVNRINLHSSIMFRSFVVAALLASCSTATGWAQSAPPTSAAPAAPQVAKPAANKPAPKASKAKSGGRAAAAESGPCQLGVIAISGGQFGVQKVGFMVFGNAFTAVPIESWGLDDLIVARVRAAAPGLSVRKIPYTKDDLARADATRSLFRTAGDSFKTFIQSAAPAACERYVVVNRERNQFSNTNQSVEGVGIVQWGNPIKERTFLFAMTNIRVFDGQTFELLKHGSASTEDGLTVSRVLLLNAIRGPNRELESAAFPAIPAEAATNPGFREGIRGLLTESLDKTLPAMLAR